MDWACAVCGSLSRTNRRRCEKCGKMRWKPVPKRDIRELAGPMKRIAPRGLLLGGPEKQASEDASCNGIECGMCHAIIYRPEGVFDRNAFYVARKKHYAASPDCEGKDRPLRKEGA